MDAFLLRSTESCICPVECIFYPVTSCEAGWVLEPFQFSLELEFAHSKNWIVCRAVRWRHCLLPLAALRAKGYWPSGETWSMGWDESLSSLTSSTFDMFHARDRNRQRPCLSLLLSPLLLSLMLNQCNLSWMWCRFLVKRADEGVWWAATVLGVM